jgi:hypothetical protein
MERMCQDMESSCEHVRLAIAGIRQVVVIQLEGSCEHGIEPSGSIKFWDILE